MAFGAFQHEPRITDTSLTQLHVPCSRVEETVEVGGGGEKPPPVGGGVSEVKKEKGKVARWKGKWRGLLLSDLASATRRVCDEVSYVPPQGLRFLLINESSVKRLKSLPLRV